MVEPGENTKVHDSEEVHADQTDQQSLSRDALTEEGANEDDRIDGFTEAELRNILKKASLQTWSESQEKSNIRFDSITAQVQYYEKLRNIDERSSGRGNDNNSKSNSKGGRRNNINKKGGKSNTSGGTTSIQMLLVPYMEAVIPSVSARY